MRFVKFDEDLYNHIIKSRNIFDNEEQSKIKEALRYNIFTVIMFSDMTGIPVSTVNSKTSPKLAKDGKIYTELDYTFPWPSLNKAGGKFIVRNEKAEELLRK
ncbi:hypothetical protein LCGC14_1312710 [marine sediment metagenome]|uniref:Uncharacterized protein n=1 Tax=marine sediment metagenome TaxID=412755 RepID=A0A0F9N2T1_9ZZZZ